MSCVGTRVKYIGKNCCITNQKGTIVEDYDIKMAMVEFDMGGIYKLRKLNLVKINESEDNDMAKLEGYKAVAVTEEGSGWDRKNYYYAIFDDGNTYKVGDHIIVNGCNSGILTIKNILTLDEAKSIGRKDLTAEVICKVDTSAYDKRVEERKEKAERKKEADKIKKQMDKMITEMDQTKRYEMYASDNPELAEKLKSYKELIGE